MTKIEFQARQLIGQWLAKKKIKLLCKPNHIHTRAQVVGYAAPGCIVVWEPWIDSAPQLQEFNRDNPLNTIRTFDPTLRAGDTCITAYVCREGCQETIAIAWGVK